jgi:hypothetical protein
VAAAVAAVAAEAKENFMTRCPVCDSQELYEYKKYFQFGGGTGEHLLPKLNPIPFFSVAAIRPTVCLTCGHIALFASESARKKAKESGHWQAAARER